MQTINPTENFTKPEPQNQSIDEFYEAKKR